MLRWVLIVVGALVAAAVAGALVFIGPRNIWGMLRYDQRRQGDLKPGDKAPDVPLLALDGTSKVRLRDRMGGRPLVLIFGSYT
jgi:hypothetical protein